MQTVVATDRIAGRGDDYHERREPHRHLAAREADPELVRVVHDGMPGSEWVVFEDSAHMAHAEETKSYLEVVNDFLTRAQASP